MCVSLSVYVTACAFPSHLPKSLRLLTKEYRSEREVPVSLKERGRWVLVFVLEASACYQGSSPFIRHQGTPVESPGSHTLSSLSVTDCLFMLLVLVQLEQRQEGWVEKLEFLSCSALPRFMGVSCRLCPRQQGISVPGAHTFQSEYLFCYRAIWLSGFNSVMFQKCGCP